MEESEECKLGEHKLCNSPSCKCGCHSGLIRPPDEAIAEDRGYLEGIPGP